MAYESLKAEIRQYIKTNGQNEITGQILQNVLIDMVNQYPSLDGYATQQWVDNQGFLTDANLEGYATQQWVNSQGFLTNADLSNYATQTWVSNNYLALIGGGTVTASGSDIQMIVSNTGFSWKVNGTTYGSILFSMTEQEGPQVKLDGALIATQTWVTNQGYLTSSSLSGYATQQWVQNQGYLTSSSISDMATQTWVGQQGYITSSAISDMATQTWVGQQGYITSSAISDMATQTWVGQQGYITSLSLGGLSNVSLTAPFDSGQALVYDFQTNKWVNGTLNYLPLTGGTLTDTTTGTPLYIKGRSSSSYIGFKNQQDTVIGYIGMAVGVQDNYPAYYDGSTAYKIWHAGNLTPSDYLAKDGGTMKGDLTISTGHDLILDSGQAYVGKIWNDGNAFTLSSEDSSSNYYDMEFYANDVHFYTNGQVYGDFVNTSDERLKDILAENVLPSVAQVAEAPAIRYRWNNLSKNRNTQEHLGSIAQYWQNVLPTAVVEDKQGYLAMHESTIALLSAISLARKIMELEKEIDDLKKQLN